MTSSNLSYRCYILPIVAAIVYVILSLPVVNAVFYDWIPDYYYSILVKSVILLIILFLTCRILDIIWTDFCHDEQCISSLNNICMAMQKNNQILNEEINEEINGEIEEIDEKIRKEGIEEINTQISEEIDR